MLFTIINHILTIINSILTIRVGLNHQPDKAENMQRHGFFGHCAGPLSQLHRMKIRSWLAYTQRSWRKTTWLRWEGVIVQLVKRLRFGRYLLCLKPSNWPNFTGPETGWRMFYVFFKMSTKIFYLDGNHVNSLAFFKVQRIFFSDPVVSLQPFLSDRIGGWDRVYEGPVSWWRFSAMCNLQIQIKWYKYIYIVYIVYIYIYCIYIYSVYIYLIQSR